MLKKFFDFGFYKVNYIAIFVLILSILYIKCFNITDIEENSLVENFQLISLGIAFVICLFAKNYKVFFKFIALVILLMILREMSYGRIFFCQVENNPHRFYPWSHYKYGFLAHILIGLYMFLSVIWALCNKIWIEVFEIINKIKFPFWTCFFSIICVFVQLISEKYLHSTPIEETAEFVLYNLILAIVYIYSKKTQEI